MTLENRSVKVGRSIMLAIMNRPELLFVAKKHITPNDFRTGVDKDCWNKIVSLDSNGKRCNPENVCNPEYADSIPADKVASWDMDECLTDCDLVFFEDRVIDFINLVDREHATHAMAILSKRTTDGELKDSFEIATAVNNLAMNMYKQHPKLSAGYIGDHILEDIKEMSNLNKDGVWFGIKSIDMGMGMINKGQFILIAARPATGKSSLFLYPLYESCKHGRHVCLNTMEMTRAEMIVRIIANRSNVMIDKIQGRVNATQYDGEAIAKAVDEIRKWKMNIIDQGMNTTSSIDSYLTKCSAEKNPVDMLILDHFGYLMPEKGASSNRYADYTNISNELKRLAKKHQCIILCLTQLNRVPDFSKPSKENMRDTGSLEQDADKIIAMWKDQSDPKIVNVGCIKNRQGQEFETRLKFYGSTMQFYEEYSTP